MNNKQVLNKEGHLTALDHISDDIQSAQTSLRHGQHARYRAKLQCALVSIQVLLQQEVDA